MSSVLTPESLRIAGVSVVVVSVSMATSFNTGPFISFARHYRRHLFGPDSRCRVGIDGRPTFSEVGMISITLTTHNDEKLEIVEQEILA
jgi:hypothetical protein